MSIIPIVIKQQTLNESGGAPSTVGIYHWDLLSPYEAYVSLSQLYLLLGGHGVIYKASVLNIGFLYLIDITN